MNLQKNTQKEVLQNKVPQNNTQTAVLPGTAYYDNNKDEIDLLELALMLMEKWHFLLLALLAGAVLLNAYAFFMIAPTYTSTAKLYVVTASDDSVVNLADLNIGTSLTADYEELIMSYPVLDQVTQKLGLDLTAKQLAGLVSISNPSNTRILNIQSTTTDPQLSCDIANTLAEVAVKYLPETMSTLSPNIAQKARLASQKTAPGYLKYTMMGALLGLILAAGYFTVLYLLDDTIHTQEDLEKYFGMVPLTVIPENENFWEDEGGKDKKEKRKGGKKDE